ncbi:MAG: metallophosphoesterase [Opitutaceae bacterium]
MPRVSTALVLTLLLISSAPARTDTLVILHTNDLHAHLRDDYDGSGGLPFVSGYIRQERSLRPDVLVVDAGDVAEKGDLVAFATDCEIVYEALGRIGYHAGAPGNHDHDFGLPQLRRFASLAHPMQMLCINLLEDDGTTSFQPSAIFDIDGVKVGVIGMIVPRNENCLDDEETGIAMSKEAERLEPLVDLTIAVCHDGAQACAALSRLAPLIDLFVSGHSHEALHEAVVVPETGARIVQAGSYAEYVGRVELVIDLDTKEIVQAESRLVAMEHDSVPCDIGMLEWIRETETRLTPEARRLVAWTDQTFDYRQLADLGAAALRSATGAEIAFCAPGQIIRDSLPIGLIDVNAVFRTGGERAHEVVETRLLGSTIESYLRGLEQSDWYQTSWSGFRASIDKGPEGPRVSTDLDPDRTYRVVLPKLEWDTRFLRLLDRAQKNAGEWNLNLPETAPPAHPVATSFTEAVTRYLEPGIKGGISLDEIIRQASAASKP